MKRRPPALPLPTGLDTSDRNTTGMEMEKQLNAFSFSPSPAAIMSGFERTLGLTSQGQSGIVERSAPLQSPPSISTAVPPSTTIGSIMAQAHGEEVRNGHAIVGKRPPAISLPVPSFPAPLNPAHSITAPNNFNISSPTSISAGSSGKKRPQTKLDRRAYMTTDLYGAVRVVSTIARALFAPFSSPSSTSPLKSADKSSDKLNGSDGIGGVDGEGSIVEVVCPEYQGFIMRLLEDARSSFAASSSNAGSSSNSPGSTNTGTTKSGGKVLVMGKIIRVRKTGPGPRNTDNANNASDVDDGGSVAVAVWAKQKGQVIVWSFEIVGETVIDLILSSRDARVLFDRMSSCDCEKMRQLFELSPNDQDRCDIGMLIPDVRGKIADGEWMRCLQVNKYHGCRSQKSGFTFPVIVKVRPSPSSRDTVTVQLVSLPAIAGMMTVSVSDNDSAPHEPMIVNCCSAMPKYLLGLSDTELVGKSPQMVIPHFDDVLNSIESIASSVAASPMYSGAYPQSAAGTATFSASIFKRVMGFFTTTPADVASSDFDSSYAPSPQSPQTAQIPHVNVGQDEEVISPISAMSGRTELSHPVQIRHRDGTMFDVMIHMDVRTELAQSPITEALVQQGKKVIKMWISFKRDIDVSAVRGAEEVEDPLRSPAPHAIGGVNKFDFAPAMKETTLPPPATMPTIKKTMTTADDGGVTAFIQKGRNFSDFDVFKKLGEGAFGTVVLVKLKPELSLLPQPGQTPPPPRKLVVLKMVPKKRILIETWANDPELGIVPREIQILYYLRKYPHPNITRMNSIFQDKDNIYMEMALHGDGMDLFDYIEHHQRLSEVQIKNIFRQVCEAVRHLHSHNIVHRDIKDENIVIDNHERIQLIDFGSAAWIDGNGKLFATFCGTLDYAPPEVVLGHQYRGPPQDVWSLGILLYTLVYKENPFYNVDEIVDGEVRVPFILNDECMDLIMRLLQPQPADRPDIDSILADTWLRPDSGA